MTKENSIFVFLLDALGGVVANAFLLVLVERVPWRSRSVVLAVEAVALASIEVVTAVLALVILVGVAEASIGVLCVRVPLGVGALVDNVRVFGRLHSAFVALLTCLTRFIYNEIIYLHLSRLHRLKEISPDVFGFYF